MSLFITPCAKFGSLLLVKNTIKLFCLFRIACQNDILDKIETKIEKFDSQNRCDILFIVGLLWVDSLYVRLLVRRNKDYDARSHNQYISQIPVNLKMNTESERFLNAILPLNTSLNPDTSTILKVSSTIIPHLQLSPAFAGSHGPRAKEIKPDKNTQSCHVPQSN